MIDAYRLAFTDSITRAFRPTGAEARWNSEGVVVVYSAEHPALAALEVLNAWQTYADLNGYTLYLCRFDQGSVLDATPEFVKEGIDPRDTVAARAYGDAWVRERRSPVLRVPSVAAPVSFNYLLNPDHPAFDSVVERRSLGAFRYDERITHLVAAARGRA